MNTARFCRFRWQRPERGLQVNVLAPNVRDFRTSLSAQNQKLKVRTKREAKGLCRLPDFGEFVSLKNPLPAFLFRRRPNPGSR